MKEKNHHNHGSEEENFRGNFIFIKLNWHKDPSASRTFKLFPIRWKWRRTRMCQFFKLLLPLLLIISSTFITSSSTTLIMETNKLKKNQWISSIYQDLTMEEARRIFGTHDFNEHIVPNLDIIKPEVFHRKTRRRRRRMIGESMEKVIKFPGLGRSFEITLRPNPNLLNFNDFVHLYRHENYSEILSDEIVMRQLHCFHHGSVTHSHHQQQQYDGKDSHYYHKQGKVKKSPLFLDLKEGRVALDICHGITGFILPTDNDPDHHYVIHPIPKRLTIKSKDYHHNAETKQTLPHHFIWRRKQKGAINEDLNFHHHRHDSGHQNPQASGSSSSSTSTCGHDSTSEAELIKSIHSRIKRSHTTILDEDDQDSFNYKKRIGSDSYWLRYRSSLTPYDFSSRSNTYENPRHTTTTQSTTINNDYNPHYSDSSFQIKGDYWSNSPYEATLPPSSPKMEDSFLGRHAPQFPFYTSRTNNIGGWSGLDDKNYTVPSTPIHLSSSSHFYRQKSMWIPTNRKGRGDDVVFGENWHSSLDSDIMATAHSNMAKSTVHKDREPAHLTIETAVFVDKDLFDHMQLNFPDDTQGEVSRIVLAMINAVQLLYQDPSLGHRVEFVLKRLEVLGVDPPGLSRPYDIDKFLTNFCKWQKTENPASDADPLHWDHALILTGLDLYVVHQSGKLSNQVVGLAPVAGMCTRSSSCTVNEGRHFESVYVMAHEIGHNLGMRHDGPQAENECDPTSHIMSPTLGSGKITWSPCSKRYLDMFLETSQSKCLLDKAKSETRLDHEIDKRLPGERFNADQQCVLKYGRGSYHATQQPIEDVCRDLHCRKQYYTWTSHPALEGTECGLEMSCRAGKCVPKSQFQDLGNGIAIGGSIPFNEDVHMSNHVGGMDGSETAAYSSLKALDGSWGKWSPFTDCSSACLYSDEGLSDSSTGIRLAARRCDSPRPENGGRQCSGLDRRYKTCTTEKLCPQNSVRTTIAQYANEVCTRAATVDTELTGRGFMTSTNDPEKACSVWCETGQGMGSRSRGWSFPDGTSCKLTSRPHGSHFCIAGKCQEFTCDMNSHFALSDELCQSTGLNIGKPTHKISWLDTRTNEGGSYRPEKSFWTKWESQSSCKLTCLAPGKGLELVQRKCHPGDGISDNGVSGVCSGLSLSVRLCKPDKSTILSNGCERLQTVFEHATKLCTKYSEKVAGLSGIGMQLSPTKDDSNRPCRIGCQDSALPYRFYMVNGEEGWFPAGTDCSRGEINKKAYCLGGKCIDFGSDDTPLYKLNAKAFGRLESILRTKRDISYKMVDERILKKLVQDFAFATPKNLSQTYNNHRLGTNTALDFSNAVLVPDLIRDENIPKASLKYSKNSQLTEIEGSFYEWRKIISDCSVSCGRGVQEVLVQCVSGDTAVKDSLCGTKEKPGESGYLRCENRQCTDIDRRMQRTGNILWSWIKSILPTNKEKFHIMIN